MNRLATTFLLLLLAFAYVTTDSSCGAPAHAALDSPKRETVRALMVKFFSYAGLEKRTTPADVDRMVELWSAAARPDLSNDERTAAFRDLFLQFMKLEGADYDGSAKSAESLAQRALAVYQGGGRLDLRLPEPAGAVSGDYIHVETFGRGPVQMLLISDAGVDGRELYRSFVERNAALYTMHVVTLPGAGLARPQPWPELFDVTRRPWLNNIEQSLARLVEKKSRAGKLVVVGTAAGGYFAARLALVKPERVRAAVLVNALVNIPMRSPASPDKPATLQERTALMKAFAPAPQLFPSAEIPTDREVIKRALDDPNNKSAFVRNWMAFAVKDETLSKRWTTEGLAAGFFMRSIRYGAELRTTDLTEDLARLNVPTLALSATPDAKSPLAGNNSPGASQWAEVKRLYPSAPLTLATFADTRSYISEDNPAEFDRALGGFLSGLAAEMRAR